MAVKARQGQLRDLRCVTRQRAWKPLLLFRSSNRYSQNAQRARSVLKKKAEITIFVFFQPLSLSTRTFGGSGNIHFFLSAYDSLFDSEGIFERPEPKDLENMVTVK